MVSDELFLIPHAHWDREWYLPFERFRVHLVNLIDRIVEIMTSDPEYRHFNLDGQTIVLEDYFEIRPENREIITKLVQEGRLGIGPWYCQPDEWQSGELLVRNLLVGITQASKIGIYQKIGYCPDLFGHVAQMPQIFQQVGIDNFMFFRGLGNDMDDPNFSNEFWWDSPDGSKVLAYYMPGGYANAKNHPVDEMEFNSFILFAYGRIDKSKTKVYYLGCGGDHYLPQKETPKLVHAFNEDEEVIEELEGGTLRIGSLTEFMDHIKSRLPTDPRERDNYLIHIKGELREGRSDIFEPGTISSRMYLKQENARCWRKLCYFGEPLSAWAFVDQKLPHSGKAFLDVAWKKLLQNQPHDSICGCSIDLVHQDMEQRFAQCAQIVDEIVKERLEHILMRQKHANLPFNLDEAIPIVIFSPHAYNASYLVKVWLAKTRDFYEPDIIFAPTLNMSSNYSVYTPEGQLLPTWIRNANYKGMHKMLKVAWRDPNFTGIGYRLYYLVPSTDPHAKSQDVGGKYENSWCKVQFNLDGSFNLLNKISGHKFEALHYLEDQADVGDGYDFSPIPSDIPIKSKGGSAIIKGKKTPFGAQFKIYYELKLPKGVDDSNQKRSSEIKTQIVYSKIRISDSIHRIDFTSKIKNKIKNHRLRAVFPTPLSSNTVNVASIYDVVQRGIGIERWDGKTKKWHQQPEPTSHVHQFVCLHDSEKGSLSVFNKGIPEYEARRMSDGNIELVQTLFRSVDREGGHLPNRGNAGSPIPTPEAQLLRDLRFDYALYFHAKSWEEDEVLSKANQYILPLFRAGGQIYIPGRRLDQNDIFNEFPKDLANNYTLLNCSNPNLILTALKQSESNQEVMLRIYNPTSTSQTGILNVGFSCSSVKKCNLLEQLDESIAGLVQLNDSHRIEIKIDPKKIFTIKIFPDFS